VLHLGDCRYTFGQSIRTAYGAKEPVVLKQMLPNFEQEAARLSELAPSGWVLAFNYTPFGPELMHSTFPKSWQEAYSKGAIFMHDPVLTWITSTPEGMIRWSEIRHSDPYNILSAARSHGLSFGVAFSRKLHGKQSFLSAARKDREFLDVEMAEMGAKFSFWTNLLHNNAGLTEDERIVLALSRDGLSQTEVAQELGLSLATIKVRLKRTHLKLNATNTTHAVAIAVTLKLI